MANVKNIITLGIGSNPTSIEYFILLGLGASGVPPVVGEGEKVYVALRESITVPKRDKVKSGKRENIT